MARPEPSAGQRQGKRRNSNMPAFIIGVPMAALILGLIHFGPLHDTLALRYVSHTVEWVEVTLFCCALGALGTKLWRSRGEWAAFHAGVLPDWDGQPVAVTEADRLSARLDRLSQRVQGSHLVKRVSAVLDFLSSRRSADELDDHLRSLADNEALALEGSYALTRFITWAIPILGFLGTVLGITEAISGVTPERLESSLNTVTDGLALAFDTTALGLALTMITMFVSFVVERTEQGVLEAVDRLVDRQLAHRFERIGSENSEFIGVLRENTQVLLRATEQLVCQQADVWARSFEEANILQSDTRHRQAEELTAAVKEALESSIETHEHRLATLESESVKRSEALLERIETLGGILEEASRQQQATLAGVIQGLAAHTDALTQLQEGEKHLLGLQEVLNQNLNTLAGAAGLDQAVHSLTAAIHLLTARSGEITGTGRTTRVGKPPGAAA